MSKIIGLDPGNEKSAYLLFDCDKEVILEKGILENKDMLQYLNDKGSIKDDTHLAIEQIKSYGMSVGQSVFDTCVWIGRFYQEWFQVTDKEPQLIPRIQIKNHLCHSSRAKDGNVRQALIDRWGEQGTKKNPGKTYKISKDMWSALAIVTYIYDNK